MAVKKITASYLSGVLLDVTVIDDTTGQVLDDTDGVFRVENLAVDTRMAIPEHLVANGFASDIKGFFEKSENRVAWPDGDKTLLYRIVGSDDVIASGKIRTVGDAEVPYPGILSNLDAKISTRASVADLLGFKTSSVIQQMVTVQDGERHLVRRAAQKSFTFVFSEDYPLAGTEKIYFTWKKDALVDPPAVDKLCTITDAAKRTCVVDFTAVEMTIDPGEYKGEVSIYDAAMTAETVRKPIACSIYVDQNVRQ